MIKINLTENLIYYENFNKCNVEGFNPLWKTFDAINNHAIKVLTINTYIVLSVSFILISFAPKEIKLKIGYQILNLGIMIALYFLTFVLSIIYDFNSIIMYIILNIIFMTFLFNAVPYIKNRWFK